MQVLEASIPFDTTHLDDRRTGALSCAFFCLNASGKLALYTSTVGEKVVDGYVAGRFSVLDRQETSSTGPQIARMACILS